MFGLDRFLTRKMIAYAVRRGLMLGGAWLIAHGWAEDAAWQEMAPGLALVVSDFCLSMYDKLQARKAVQVAIALPPTATEADVRDALKA